MQFIGGDEQIGMPRVEIMARLTPAARQHSLFGVPALGKIVLYLVVVVFLGAVLAPPIYWMLHGNDPVLSLPESGDASDGVCSACSSLVVAGIRSSSEFGLERNSRAARDALTGLFLALAPGALFGVVSSGACMDRTELMPFLLLRIA